MDSKYKEIETNKEKNKGNDKSISDSRKYDDLLQNISIKLTNLEMQNKEHHSNIKNTNNRIDEIDKLIQLLKQANASKAEREEIDNIINLLSQKTEGGNTGTGLPINTKDSAILKDITFRMASLEIKFKEMASKLPSDIGKLQTDLNTLKTQFAESNSTMEAHIESKLDIITHDESTKLFNSKIEEINNKIAHLTKDDTDMSRRIKLLEEKMETVRSSAGTSDSNSVDEIKRLATKIDECNAKLVAQNDSYESKFTVITEKLLTLIQTKEFNEFKIELTKSMEDMISQISKRFAEKAWVKKWMATIEADIKKLYEMMEEYSEHTENAMLSKKPLGGLSCASCEKNLTNLQGLRSQFLVWGKFPKREGEKLLNKSGYGFSKILSMVKPEELEKSETVRIMTGEKETESPQSEEKKTLRPISTIRQKNSRLPTVRKSNY